MKLHRILILALLPALFMLNSCQKTQQKQFNAATLIYDHTVSEEDVMGTGMYLSMIGFFGKKELKSKLIRQNDVVQFKFIAEKNIHPDESYFDDIQTVAENISKSVFKGREVEIHMCRPDFQSIWVISSEAIIAEDLVR